MIKIIGLFSRRPDLSHEAFSVYYEERHVPLIRRVLPPFDRYARNYVTAAGDRERLGYDVLTEACFNSSEAFDRVQVAMAEAEILAQIAEDEAQFMDRDRSFSFVVTERAL